MQASTHLMAPQLVGPTRFSGERLKHWRAFGAAEWRHVRDGALGLLLGSLLPVGLFYFTLRLWSFPAAVVVVLSWSALIFAWHRHRTGGADIFSAATFGFACLQALVGLGMAWLASDAPDRSVQAYLAWPSAENLIYGSVFLGSALAGRPLLALYARRLYPVPARVQATASFRRAFLVASLAWFVGLGLRGLLRLWLLLSMPLELYLVVNTVAGWPFSLALVGFTVWYPLRELRRAGLMLHVPPVLGDLEEAVEEAAPGAP